MHRTCSSLLHQFTALNTRRLSPFTILNPSLLLPFPTLHTMSTARTSKLITLRGSAEIVVEFFGNPLSSANDPLPVSSPCRDTPARIQPEQVIAFANKNETLSNIERCITCTNSILFQRGLYPPEGICICCRIACNPVELVSDRHISDFRPVKKYGLAMMVATNESLNAYLRQVLAQVGGMLMMMVFLRLPPQLTFLQHIRRMDNS